MSSAILLKNVMGTLTKNKNVAVVELFHNPSKDTYKVAEHFKKHGLHIVPIDPFVDWTKKFKMGRFARL